MGSSTGNLLVDSPVVLENFFSKFPSLIATHCEDEAIIQKNTIDQQNVNEYLKLVEHNKNILAEIKDVTENLKLNEKY
jgi:dihydroorotase